MLVEEVTGIRFMFFVWSQAVLASVRLFGSVQSLGQCVTVANGKLPGSPTVLLQVELVLAMIQSSVDRN